MSLASQEYPFNWFTNFPNLTNNKFIPKVLWNTCPMETILKKRTFQVMSFDNIKRECLLYVPFVPPPRSATFQDTVLTTLSFFLGSFCLNVDIQMVWYCLWNGSYHWTSLLYSYCHCSRYGPTICCRYNLSSCKNSNLSFVFSALIWLFYFVPQKSE